MAHPSDGCECPACASKGRHYASASWGYFPYFLESLESSDMASKQTNSVYLAARYSRRLEIAAYKEQLEADGWTVTSRWLLGNHQAENDDLHPGAAAEQFALEDLADVDGAEWFVIFPEAPRKPTTMRGGAHVEYGYALARSKRMLIVGPRANVFHCVSGVGQVDTFEEARTVLSLELAGQMGAKP